MDGKTYNDTQLIKYIMKSIHPFIHILVPNINIVGWDLKYEYQNKKMMFLKSLFLALWLKKGFSVVIIRVKAWNTFLSSKLKLKLVGKIWLSSVNGKSVFEDNSYLVGLVGFYGISTIVGYLMPNPLYTYILDIYNLVWFGFMAYQTL